MTQGTQRSIAILFADITGSTSLYERVGNERAKALVTDSLRRTRAAVERLGGTVMDEIGDEVMATFDAADPACRAAIAIQDVHEGGSVAMRIGFHFGDVIHEGRRIYGEAVNLAARIAAFAKADEIITSRDAVERLGPEMRRLCEYMDTRTFKGLSEPVSVYRVTWRDEDDDRTDLPGVTLSDGTAPERGPTNRILVLQHGERIHRLTAGDERFTIGRSQGCGLQVGGTDGKVSRHHAHIAWTLDKFVWTETSSNGSFFDVDGHVLHLKRDETANLTGEGTIGLGRSPWEKAAAVIRYRVIDA